MKNIMKLIEVYLRKHPSPTQITAFQNIFKLSYTYSTPYTDSKNVKEILHPITNLNAHLNSSSIYPKLTYNEKGRIEEIDSFDSIMVKEKHEKIFQDDVFGSSCNSKNKNRWLYIAEIKQEVPKSYFANGKGKNIYKYDLGETYDEVREVAIFIWDKELKKVFKVEIDSNLIPANPSFLNDEGTQIMFHAYKKQHFGHGILHCFNRPVKIYHAALELKSTEKDNKKQQKIQSKVKLLIEDGQVTNIFASLSQCGRYILYLSGSGITHTYYMDLVIIEKSINADGCTWKENHRIRDTFVGYYNTLKTFTAFYDAKSFAYVQTLQGGAQIIYRIDLANGQIVNFSKNSIGQSYSISDVYPTGLILGKISTHNYNTFFYAEGEQINALKALSTENFTLKQYSEPIHAYYLEACEDEILPEYRIRSKKRPLALIIHGGPHGSIDPCLTLLRFVLLKLGYAVLLPNFSGSTGFGQKRLNNALQSIGETDSKEIIELLEKVLNQNPSLDRENVHVSGGSYGGFMAAIMGSRYSKYFKTAVIMNGVLNIPANLWFTDIPEWNTVETLGKDKLSELTSQDYQSMYKQSPTSEPMKIPTLQFLGAKDRRVPHRQGLLFDAITKEYGTPITTYVYQNSGHSLADSVETTIDIIMKFVSFVEGIKDEGEDKPKENDCIEKQGLLKEDAVKNETSNHEDVEK